MMILVCFRSSLGENGDRTHYFVIRKSFLLFRPRWIFSIMKRCIISISGEMGFCLEAITLITEYTVHAKSVIKNDIQSCKSAINCSLDHCYTSIIIWFPKEHFVWWIFVSGKNFPNITVNILRWQQINALKRHFWHQYKSYYLFATGFYVPTIWLCLVLSVANCIQYSTKHFIPLVLFMVSAKSVCWFIINVA